MSIIDKLKKAHPAYWVLGLGGAALAVDYYVEKDRSVASSIYRKLFGPKSLAGDGGGRAALAPDGAAVMPGSLYRTTQVYYPAFPPVHPHHHWMLRKPFFEGGFGRDWYGRHDHGFGHHGRGDGYGRGDGFGHHEYGAFGRNHVR